MTRHYCNEVTKHIPANQVQHVAATIDEASGHGPAAFHVSSVELTNSANWVTNVSMQSTYTANLSKVLHFFDTS